MEIKHKCLEEGWIRHTIYAAAFMAAAQEAQVSTADTTTSTLQQLFAKSCRREVTCGTSCQSGGSKAEWCHHTRQTWQGDCAEGGIPECAQGLGAPQGAAPPALSQHPTP